MTESGKDIGEAMLDEEVERIFKNVEDLVFDGEVVIEDFAKYLMTHWFRLSINYCSIKDHINNLLSSLASTLLNLFAV